MIARSTKGSRETPLWRGLHWNLSSRKRCRKLACSTWKFRRSGCFVQTDDWPVLAAFEEGDVQHGFGAGVAVDVGRRRGAGAAARPFGAWFEAGFFVGRLDLFEDLHFEGNGV